MVAGLRLIALRSVGVRKGRSALTTAGLVLGVGLYFGVATVVTSVESLATTVGAGVFGTANVVVLPIGGLSATMPAAVADRARAVPGAGAVVPLLAAPVGLYGADGRSTVRAGSSQPPAVLVGVDSGELSRIYRLNLDAGRLPAPGAAEAALPRTLASRLGLEVGSSVVVSAASGRRPLKLVGLIGDDGAGLTNLGQVVYTSLSSAQELDAHPGAVSALAVATTSPGHWVDRARKALGPQVQVATSDAEAQYSFGGVQALGQLFRVFAAAIVFVGAFLIYLTMSVAVAERTRLFGTVRAIGATRAALRRLVLTEAAALGVIGTALGLALGVAVAAGMLVLVGGLFSVSAPTLRVSAANVITAVTLGMVATLVSTALPARRAARVDPALAIRGTLREERVPSHRWWLGAGCLVAAGVLTRGTSGVIGTGGVILLVLLGAVLVLPTMLGGLARLFVPAARASAGGVGVVAVRHAARHRDRSAFTLGLVTIVLALVLAVVASYASMSRAFDRQVSQQFAADVQLTAASVFTNADLDVVRRTPGVAVAAAQSVGGGQVVRAAHQQHVDVAGIDVRSYLAAADFAWADGDDASATAAMERGGAVIVPAPLARQWHVKRGDQVQLRTPDGQRAFTIAGTFWSFLFETQHRLYLSRGDAASLGIQRTTDIYLRLAPGARSDDVAASLHHALDPTTGFIAQSSTTVRKQLRAQFNGFFSPSYAIIAAAAAVSALGLANTLAISMIERTRELGVLRAVGARRRHLRDIARVESVFLVLTALILAVPVGWWLSRLLLRAMGAGLQLSVTPSFPWQAVPIAAVTALVIGVAAALAPARRAGRIDIVKALHWD